MEIVDKEFDSWVLADRNQTRLKAYESGEGQDGVGDLFHIVRMLSVSSG